MLMSETIGEISKALTQAWGKVESPKHNKTVEVKTKSGYTYTFDYTDLKGILDAVKKPFKENGITIIQQPYTEQTERGTTICVDTMLLHSSGEWMRSQPLKLPIQNNIQDVGGQITYMKRYSLSAMLGISAEDDDDANMSDGNEFDYGQKQANPITPEQVGMIKTKALQLAQLRKVKDQAIYANLGIKDIEKIDSTFADTAISRLDAWIENAKKEQGA